MLDSITLRAALLVLGRGGRPEQVDKQTDIAADLRRLGGLPPAHQRPLVVLNGYHTPPNVARWAAYRLALLTGRRPADVLAVSYTGASCIHRAAEQAARMVNARHPSGEPGVTAELDVVGISMGGLVARVAAGHGAEGGVPRMTIARLFTYGTPHNGSIRAARVAPDRAARDMKPGSPFLERLNTMPPPAFELTCYAQEGDNLVAPGDAAPPGMSAFVAPGSRLMSHFTTLHNPWFLADTARRLRGEEPLLRHA